MNTEHVLPDEVFTKAQVNYRRANPELRLMITVIHEEADVYFLRTETEAKDFARNNTAASCQYKIVYANSISALLNHLPYGIN